MRDSTASNGDGADVSLLHRMVAPPRSSLPFPRLLVVFAHPDDEVLALGGRLERLSSSRLLTVTDGAPEDRADAAQHGFASLAAYRAARRAELLAALADAGLPAETAPAFAAAVADQTASLHLATIARAVAAEIETFVPEAVLTHPYEGGHPDHDACAFAVHAAVGLVRGRGKMSVGLSVLEAPSYHADGRGGMATATFLEHTPGEEIAIVELDFAAQERKRRRLACFPSQAETLAQFGVARELFREAPVYDFTQRPHPGKLFYEQFPWGMSGDRFCALAEAALRELLDEQQQRASDPARDGVPAG